MPRYSEDDYNPFAAPVSDLAPETFRDPLLDAPGKLVYAGFLDRLVAAFLDMMITQGACGIFTIMALIVIGVADSKDDTSILFAVWFFFLICPLVFLWLYNALQESSEARATVGKRLMRLRVVDLSGERLSFAQASGRFFAKFPSALLLIGYLIQPFTERKQALHDILASTVVIHR
ncbi:MAG: transporter [Planctomycetaceae bacterium]|nr:transporter [Planctomycetaceae bacterium]